MMMIEEGKVRLNDPVSKFIPEFKEMKVAVQKEPESEVQLVPAEREITIRDLMTHTSGLASGGLGTRRVPRGSLWPKEKETLESLMPQLAKVPLDFQPGSAGDTAAWPASIRWAESSRSPRVSRSTSSSSGASSSRSA